MNYYNERDPYPATWLEYLIKAKLIPDGKVDTRSICDVKASDLKGFTQCHFFAGIGGWSYALRLAEWPESREVWTGSCPCQPFSAAGLGLGEEDERHLWPWFYALIAECLPAVVFGEQVASPDGRQWLAGVRADVEALAYGFGAADLCAAGVRAPHLRQRLYWVADSFGDRRPAWSRGAFAQTGAAARLARWDDVERCGGLDGALRLGNAESNGEHRSTWEREAREGRAPRGPNSNAVRMGDAASDRCERLGAGTTAKGRSRKPGSVAARELSPGPEGPGSALRIPDANFGAVAQPDRASVLSTGGPWGDFYVKQCGDGKARRVPAEPAFFPVFNGLPGLRVGLLRGAGNAIVPQVAEQFIRAYKEAFTAKT